MSTLHKKGKSNAILQAFIANSVINNDEDKS